MHLTTVKKYYMYIQVCSVKLFEWNTRIASLCQIPQIYSLWQTYWGHIIFTSLKHSLFCYKTFIEKLFWKYWRKQCHYMHRFSSCDQKLEPFKQEVKLLAAIMQL
jgi:hypothetical protein